MGRIQVLDRAVSEKIAAGEVVERPSSVVKELLENSIDAGSTYIIVEIKNGGISYIRVTDNGCGMDMEDATRAFLRHATSKIKSEADLESIHTLGFRGEALCSISAVSEVELFTKMKELSDGSYVKIVGGELVESSLAGCPDGTTITVKNLFFNTPARLKFLKKDSTEAGYIIDICQKIALSHPDISIKLINNGKEVFFTPGDNNLNNAIYAIYGKDFANNMVEVNYQNKGISLYGFVGNEKLSRPNKSMQIFFVNGRYVQNSVLSFALSESYKNTLMTGRFPVGVLNVKINPLLVDVNVHPAKTEVKFAQDQDIYDLVFYGVKNAHLNQKDHLDFSDIKDANKGALKFVGEQTEAKQQTLFTKARIIKEDKSASVLRDNELKVKDSTHQSGSFIKVDINKFSNGEEKTPKTEDEKYTIKTRDETWHDGLKGEAGIPDYKYVGQLFNTYIIIETENEMIMVDQHAAHERLNFEKLKEEFLKKSVPAQILMVPQVVNLTKVEMDCANQHKDTFFKMGFEIDDFGNNSLVIRTAPCDIDFSDVGSVFIEILNLFLNHAKEHISNFHEEALKMIACKSSIKANGILTKEEATRLVDDVFEKDLKSCPHGRPIMITMTKYQIEKMFKRIV